MLDIKLIREKPEWVREQVKNKNIDAPIEAILDLDTRRRTTIHEVEDLKARRNEGSKQVAKAKDPSERQTLIAEMKSLGDEITTRDEQIRQIDTDLRDLMLGIPNIPDPDVPIGKDETDNVVVREGGTKKTFDFQPKPHWEIAEHLGIIDFERGVKVAGSHSYFLRGDGARLQRALIAWMIDVHVTRHGYNEVIPPLQVLGEMLVGTGSLPKFADTLFRDIEDDRWLIPTSEVPVTNLYRDEILDEDMLPIYQVAATPCFRREQMSSGRDVRGIRRGYEFYKVELVKFAHPETSEAELQRILEEALTIVNELELPWHVLDLCTGDMTFASAHTYDIETWTPGSNDWMEISSCSLFRDYQARRANLRFRPTGGKPEFLHTLNGSGLALPRVLIAILENYQREDGIVEIPTVLRPYLGGQEVIGVQKPWGPSRAQS